MHWLKNALGWGLLILAGIVAALAVGFVVVVSVVTIWAAGGAALIWALTGEVSPGWQQIPTLHVWVGFSCLGIMASFFAWALWDELKWKMLR